MNIPPEHSRGEAAKFGGFDPVRENIDFKEISGGRRKVATIKSAASIHWNWPEERKEQHQSFDDWHDIAMQILHRANASFRLMAVYRKVFWWKEGCIWASNEEMALDAGHCNIKTVSRDIAIHARLGIIKIERGWRRAGSNIVRTRAIRLAVPRTLDEEIVVRDLRSLPFGMDTRGPDQTQAEIDTRGPGGMDTRGPITLDTHEEGASRNVSA